jgi:hypothetical protein
MLPAMKKTCATTLFSLMILLAALRTEGQSYHQGINIWSAGLSVGSALTMGSSARTPMFNLQYERGLVDLNGSGFISLGGYGAYNVYYLGDDKFSYTIVGVRAAYHLSSAVSGNIDFYGGMMGGYDFRGAPSNGFRKRYMGLSGNDLYQSKFDFMPFLGARFFMNDNMAIFTEFSYGSAFLSLGLAWAL